MNGPDFTWPLFMFASALPERLMARFGKIHEGRPLRIKSRKELLATIKPAMRRYLRPDTGDMPDDMGPPVDNPRVISLVMGSGVI
jgi:hypothetical protein